MYETSKVIIAKRDGWCNHCGKNFKAGEPFRWHFSQRKGYCPSCPCEPKQTVDVVGRKDISNVDVKTIEAMSYNVPKLIDLFDGRFTIPFLWKGDPTKRHITLWITTKGKDSKYPGSRRIRVLHGRDNEREYVDVAYITVGGKLCFLNLDNDATFSQKKIVVLRSAVKLLAEGSEQDKYGMCYALISRKCWRCGRTLTNPETLKLKSGLGPICDKYVEGRGVVLGNISEPEPVTFGI
jgi:hypothetical protein